VTVADGGDAPSDKACGEGILPEGLAALERAFGGRVGLVCQAECFVEYVFVKGETVGASGIWPVGRPRHAANRNCIAKLIRARGKNSGAVILRRTVVTGIAENLVSASSGNFHGGLDYWRGRIAFAGTRLDGT